MKDFKNKVVVITGAGSGIGRALATAFAKRGAKLALNDFNEHALKETSDSLAATGVDVFRKNFDVADKDAFFLFSQETADRFGHVDIMINNAGIGLGDYVFHEVDLDLVERVMDINYFGVLYGSRAFIPHLLKQPEAALVNISSIFGLTGIARSTAYCSSKFAVYGLNQCLMQEYAGTNLRIHSVHPGGINTNITQNSLDYKSAVNTETHDAFQKQFLKISPDYAAEVIINGIQKKKQKILIGKEAHLLDLAVRFFPSLGGTIVNKTIQRQLESIGLKTKTI
ncbi:MAG: putative oxidoreductase SadH [Bacteroidia bacterium]|nr:putative oxidoreductase SadH [Bacteroidia bacterium]